jgi:hypothetical protein
METEFEEILEELRVLSKQLSELIVLTKALLSTIGEPTLKLALGPPVKK